MIRFVIIPLLSVLICIAEIQAQTVQLPYKIRYVKIEGNEKTQDFVILKQVPVKFGDELTEKQIIFFVDRVYSLGLFTSVSYRLSFNADTKDFDLIIIVHEKWFWLIYPVVRFKDSNVSRFINNPSGTKVQYGFGLSHINFLGRRMSLRLTAVTGYDLNIGFAFNNPHSFLDDNISFGASVSYSEIHNQSPYLQNSNGEFLRRIRSVSNGIGYSFSPYLNGSVNLYYNSISNAEKIPNKSDKEIVLNPNGSADDNFGIGLVFNYDTRDIFEFAMSGIFLAASVNYSQELNTNSNYESTKIDFRSYYPLNDGLTLAGNFIHQKYYGDIIPYYDHYFMGRDEVVRGFENQYIESTNRLISKFELRKELIPIRTDVVDWISWEQFKYFRWAIYGYFYSDFAFNFRPNQVYQGLNQYISENNLSKYYNNLLSDIGVGIHFSLPYNNSLRFELNYNSLNEKSFWINSSRPF